MGSYTDVTGVLTFKNELSIAEYKRLERYVDLDIRDVPENEQGDGEWYYNSYQINEDATGLIVEEGECVRDLDEIANWITDRMRAEFPNFTLEGELFAHDRDYDDKYKIKMVDGVAKYLQGKITVEYSE